MPRAANAAAAAALAVLLLAASLPCASARALAEADDMAMAAPAPAPADGGGGAAADAPASAPAAKLELPGGGADGITISGGAALLSADCYTKCYDKNSEYQRCLLVSTGCREPAGCDCHPPGCVDACLYYCSCTDPECMAVPACGPCGTC